MKLKKVLAEKSRKKINTISGQASLKEAAETLCERGVGALLVVDGEPDKYIGIISERDIIKKICNSADLNEIRVTDIMTRDLIVAKSEDNVDYVMSVMDRKHIRHIPVMEGDKIVGVLSIRDIIRSKLEENTIEIRHLSDYVCGTNRNEVY